MFENGSKCLSFKLKLAMILLLLAGAELTFRHYSQDNYSYSLEFTDHQQFLCHPPFPNFRLDRKIRTCLAADNVTYGSDDLTTTHNLSLEVEGSQPNRIFSVKLQNQTVVKVHEPRVDSVYFHLDIKDSSTKYGLGERFQKTLRIEEGHYVIFNRDRPHQIDEHLASDLQTYGYFPMYLARSGLRYHILQIQTQHPMKALVKDQYVNFTFTGIYKRHGVKVTVFSGLEPQQLLREFHSKIGRAALPPFWSLGYHQSRWGYNDINTLKHLVTSFQIFKLPLDAVWSDLDYMSDNKVFTIDTQKFPLQEMRAFVKKVRWVPLVDCGLGEGSQAYRQGLSQEVLIKDRDDSPYVGRVWPGISYFFDFINPKASTLWQSQLESLYSLVQFSGLWLDMNQPSNFYYSTKNTFDPQHKIAPNSLQTMTVALDAKHHYGLRHVEVHSYYGDLVAEASYNFLNGLKNSDGKLKSLPFVLTRSATFGTSRFAAHWTGDNSAKFQYLRLSISGNLLFGIFGVPMVGADICGFSGNTWADLCARWYQLGSLYPFARNHNQKGYSLKQPYTLGESVMSAFRNSFNQRYSLLRHFYSQMVFNKGIGTFFRPLFLQFPYDQTCFQRQIEQTQFMIGDTIMSAPILQANTASRSVYFPHEFFWLTGLEKDQPKVTFYPRGKSDISVATNVAVPIFVRTNKILFVNSPAVNTKDLSNYFTLLIFLDSESQHAEGKVLSIHDYENATTLSKCYEEGCHLHFAFKGGEHPSLTYRYEGTAQIQGFLKVKSVRIFTPEQSFKAEGFELDGSSKMIKIKII